MPYIKMDTRHQLSKGYDMEGPGELNYLITRLVHRYEEQRGTSYQTFNDIMGALEGCKMELYRRRIAPYEDKKMKENGDVGD